MAKTAAPTKRNRKKTSSRSKSTARSAPRPGKLTTYHQAVRHLLDRIDLERARPARLPRSAFKLDRIRAMMRKLGDPQADLNLVHVAGSKGKGSVCHMVARGLEASGYTVGLYTSPHLVDVRERIQIGGDMISQAAFVELMNRVAKAEAAVRQRHGEPTFFEMLTAMAFCHFADQAVDVAVIETGLGGRLDATNIIDPLVAAVCGISLDHTQILGDTVDAIAREKAGIFKKSAPAITFRQSPEAMDALREIAESKGANFEIVGEDIEFSFRFEATPKVGPHTTVCLSTERSSFEHVTVPLPGEHQALNCGLALAILDRLRERGFEFDETTVIEGLAGLVIPGRMELAWTEPRILLDGAHNAVSLQALMRSIGAHVPYDSMVIIFGCAEDKDVDALLDQVSLGADKVIFTQAASNPRAVPAKTLQKRFHTLSGKMTQIAETLPDAIRLAARAVTRDDLICVTGSFYLVGEAKKFLAERASGR